jgi:hypothetical protein
MTKFKVKAQYTVYLETKIEAEDENQAWEIAQRLSGDTFWPISEDNWEIYDVSEMTL